MLTLNELGVFLAATSGPCIVFWTVCAIRGRSGTIYPSMFVVCAAFGLGVAIIARAKGWV